MRWEATRKPGNQSTDASSSASWTELNEHDLISHLQIIFASHITHTHGTHK